MVCPSNRGFLRSANHTLNCVVLDWAYYFILSALLLEDVLFPIELRLMFVVIANAVFPRIYIPYDDLCGCEYFVKLVGPGLDVASPWKRNTKKG